VYDRNHIAPNIIKIVTTTMSSTIVNHFFDFCMDNLLIIYISKYNYELYYVKKLLLTNKKKRELI